MNGSIHHCLKWTGVNESTDELQVQYKGVWWFSDGDVYLNGNMLTHGPNAHTTYQMSVSLPCATKVHRVNSNHYQHDATMKV